MTGKADQDHDAEDDSGHESSSLLGALASGAWKLGTSVPRRAYSVARWSATEAEKLALTTLKRRMEAVSDDDAAGCATDGSSEGGVRAAASRTAQSSAADAPQKASQIIAQLLEDSMEQTADQARERVLLRIARELVPDEARILAGLADGHAAALVHVGAGQIVGPATQRWLENLSPVGKECGVRLLDEVPNYIRHLRDLGLLESDEEDKSLQLKYQIIEADTKVREVCTQIEKSGMRPKFFRRTIRMSEAGKAFWVACETGEKQGW
jgi:hypothetical protein